MAREQYPENVYLSPCFAIKRFLGLRDKYSDREAIEKVEFKPEREMWVAGVFLLGINQLTHRDYWLKPNTQDTAPDIFAISFAETERGTVAEIQSIEIFEYESHAKISLVAAIRKKLENKSYPDNYLLLCYIHSRPGEELELKKVFQSVKKLDSQIAQIWLLASVLGDGSSSEHILAQIFPHLFAEKFDYVRLCKTTEQKEMIRAKRDLRKKTTGVDFELLGDYILRLP